ncbi:rhamnogalacturonan lyase [Amphibacillus sp. MSJ-3]|uniref:rhamnogalacturonan lyase n=1 Tax=Amphibacillus sp. MSJ-3 TaxID=2841505 RepID=UPI001C0F2230|nr:rhamnogalacturonan lyase [Amphibacillus sp. MSJ-3]MBU5593820.1 rhamnogalacturonan lyase [Amphibacillus sp. MSJ-3]
MNEQGKIRRLEDLDRGLIAIKTETGVFLSWRISIEEFDHAEYEIYRDGQLIHHIDRTQNSNYLDKEGKVDSLYVVRAITRNGVEESNQVSVLDQNYFDIPLDKPVDGITPNGEPYTYSANDLSVGDVTGDGRYEVFVKWYPSNAKDNAHTGYTGHTYLDCYTLEGEKLWRIDLGPNIRSGAHYTQFLVYDFDGDGVSELICKTADGTIDGQGNVIGDRSKDYRNEKGFILDGPEYLTLFDGRTGKALDTIDYKPDRGVPGSWGDHDGNRIDRYLAGVAYLNGETASAVVCRGYYTRAVLVAYDVVDKKLVERWCADSDNNMPKLAGQGAHSLSVADVDNDGFDEIIYGSAVVDHDGSLLYSTGFGHGDALHVGDFDLDNPGLEIFMTHEESPHEHGFELHDAKTGKVLFSLPSDGEDIGRGVAADIDPRFKGAQLWGYAPEESNRVAGTEAFYTSKGDPIEGPIPPANFVIWWDGDLGREILDHDFDPAIQAGVGTIMKWNWETEQLDLLLRADGTLSNNGTKGNPNLQADLFGDWREEVIWRLEDSSALRVFTTTDLSEHRLYTLMHDSQYRVAIAWQNVAYNQPPHPSFYIGFDQSAMQIPLPKVKLVRKK